MNSVTEAPPDEGGPGAEPVAIVGISALYPQARGVDAFWSLMTDPAPGCACTPGARGAAPRLDAGGVDVARYGIPPAQAGSMAAMQKLMLEAARQCLTDAGYAERPLPSDRADVLAGICFGLDRQYANARRVESARYAEELRLAAEASDDPVTRRAAAAAGAELADALRERLGASPHDRVGEMGSTIPARIAGVFRLRGRTVAMESADLTSHVLLAHAAGGLRAGTSDAALVLAGQLHEGPLPSAALTAKGLGASCTHPLDPGGHGYALAEGVGALLLKRLSSAVRDGDRVYALLRTCALTHTPAPGTFRYPASAAAHRDSASRALLPDAAFPPGPGGSPPGAAGRAAPARTRAEAGAVQYVEVAGTGVGVVAAAEIAGAAAALGERADGGEAVVGSVRDRLGHTFANSGLAAVTKVALGLYHRRVPPHWAPGGVAAADLAATPFRTVPEPRPWPSGHAGAPRRALVGATSLTGSAAHLLLEEYDPRRAAALGPVRDPGADRDRDRDRDRGREPAAAGEAAQTALGRGAGHGLPDARRWAHGSEGAGEAERPGVRAAAAGTGRGAGRTAPAGGRRWAQGPDEDRERGPEQHPGAAREPGLDRARPGHRGAARAPEPVAVVGFGGAFAGVGGGDALWEVFLSGRDRFAPLPHAVLDRRLHHAPGALSLNHTYTDLGAWMAPPREPPPGVPITPRRWAAMDAAQKVTLAVAAQFLDRRGACGSRGGPEPRPVPDPLTGGVPGGAPGAGTADGALQGTAHGTAPGSADHTGTRPYPRLAGRGIVAVGSNLSLTRERMLNAALCADDLEAAVEDLPALAALPAQERKSLAADARSRCAERAGGPLGPADLDGVLASGVAAVLAHEYRLPAVPVAVEAACASSLAALDVAVTALRAGSADFAVAGGVELPCNPRDMTLCSALGLLSHSTITPFDAAADGFTPGDGCGLFLLKRLSDAVADGDHVLGVLRGVGASNDAKSLIAPDTDGQARAVRDAFEQAGFGPETVDYLEAHGTGTRVGDRVEIAAAARTYATAGRRPLHIGSAKSFLGHTFAAAGAAGLLRVLLALRAGTLPPHTNLTTPAPELGLDAVPAVVPDRPLPWPAPGPGLPRRAGVSSFGTGGINFHLLVEEHLADGHRPQRPLTDGHFAEEHLDGSG